MSVEDLPGLWNQKMAEYLGCTPSNDAEGILQVFTNPCTRLFGFVSSDRACTPLDSSRGGWLPLPTLCYGHCQWRRVIAGMPMPQHDACSCTALARHATHTYGPPVKRGGTAPISTRSATTPATDKMPDGCRQCGGQVALEGTHTPHSTAAHAASRLRACLRARPCRMCTGRQVCSATSRPTAWAPCTPVRSSKLLGRTCPRWTRTSGQAGSSRCESGCGRRFTGGARGGGAGSWVNGNSCNRDLS